MRLTWPDVLFAGTVTCFALWVDWRFGGFRSGTVRLVVLLALTLGGVVGYVFGRMPSPNGFSEVPILFDVLYGAITVLASFAIVALRRWLEWHHWARQSSSLLSVPY